MWKPRIFPRAKPSGPGKWKRTVCSSTTSQTDSGGKLSQDPGGCGAAQRCISSKSCLMLCAVKGSPSWKRTPVRSSSSSVCSSGQRAPVASAGTTRPSWSTRIGSSIVFQVINNQLSGDGSKTWIVPTGARHWGRVGVDCGLTIVESSFHKDNTQQRILGEQHDRHTIQRRTIGGTSLCKNGGTRCAP